MAQKMRLRELGMDTMERLYYERQNERKKAYIAKRRKNQPTSQITSAKSLRIKHNADAFDRALEHTIYNMC